MSLKRKGNIFAVLNMPDATEAEVREKLKAAIRVISQETDYIEERVTIDYNGKSLPDYLASLDARLTAIGA